MIRVKRGAFTCTGSKNQVFSECIITIISCAKILAENGNMSVEEAINVLLETAKEANRRGE